jgi:hypothetical protein
MEMAIAGEQMMRASTTIVDENKSLSTPNKK